MTRTPEPAAPLSPPRSPSVASGKPPAPRWRLLACTLPLALAAVLGGCRLGPPPDEQADGNGEAAEYEGELVFRNITLNRSDDLGRPEWQVKAAEARYSRDRQTAQLRDPAAKLYDDGELAYEISADAGQITDNGKFLRLEGNVRARDVRDEVDFEGQEVTWEPDTDVLVFPDAVKAVRGDVTVVANRGRAEARSRRLELQEEVEAISKDKKVRLSSDRLVWEPEKQEALASGDALLIGAGGDGLPEEMRLRGDRLIWRVEKQEAEALGEVLALGKDPDLALASDRLIWQMKQQQVDALGNVQALARDPEVRLTSDRLVWQMKQQQAEATGTVRAASRDPDVRLATERLVWQIEAEVAQAVGETVAVGRDPAVQVQTRRLVWEIGPNRVTSDTRTQVDRYACAGGTCQLSDRAIGNWANVDLNSKIAYLRDDARVTLRDPDVSVASEALTWAFDDQRLSSDVPVTVFERQQQVVLSASRGDLDAKAGVANLIGNVRGLARARPARMRSDRLIWSLKNQEVQAIGNVFYQQDDPPLVSRGGRAFGSFRDSAMVLWSGPNRRAATTFVPETVSPPEPQPSPTPGAPAAPGQPAPPPSGPPAPPPVETLPGTLPPVPADFPRTLAAQPFEPLPEPDLDVLFRALPGFE